RLEIRREPARPTRHRDATLFQRKADVLGHCDTGQARLNAHRYGCCAAMPSTSSTGRWKATRPVGGHFIEVVVPRLARIETKPLPRLAGEQIPGALDILGGEGLAVVPFDPLAQWESQFGSVLAP